MRHRGIYGLVRYENALAVYFANIDDTRCLVSSEFSFDWSLHTVSVVRMGSSREPVQFFTRLTAQRIGIFWPISPSELDMEVAHAKSPGLRIWSSQEVWTSWKLNRIRMHFQLKKVLTSKYGGETSTFWCQGHHSLPDQEG
jgi:hypothetical protein